ncbi:glycosyltransferase family 2 protein [Desulfonatronum thioautotrophicum]|uniref:glycosyltransferase family 2 protein n=1 Tax=Desulfonatronum thioautotrophicum TaxID=617001 RepID=UPI00069AE685|nr:glycosyltransferase family 2 protein [Desulfonatronum thioautotrophicum]
MTADAKMTLGYVSLLVSATCCAGVLLFAAGLPLLTQQQFLFGWGLLLTFALLRRASFLDADLQRMALMALCLFISLRYWLFRTFDTLIYTGPLDFVAMMTLYLAETYGIAVLFLGMFVNAAPKKRVAPPVDFAAEDLPTVDVFIPTYNEPPEMVATTVTAATQMDYPKNKLNIFILDDGGTAQKRMDPDPKTALAAIRRADTLRNLARFLGVNYTTRGKNDHAKAGNLNQALKRTSFGLLQDDSGTARLQVSEPQGFGDKGGELILVLDCDHVPAKDFLRNTVGFFQQDPKLFLVQTPHFFINPDPVERNLALGENLPQENEMFFGSVLPGLDFWNSAFFCGSAALLRRQPLIENGGIAGETITEDAETAMMLHAKGFTSVYLDRPMVCGLSPETFGDLTLQRNRWAQGMVQLFTLKNPLRNRGLSLAQRLCYTNLCGYWFFGVARIIFFLAPLFYLFFGLLVYNASLPQILGYAVPHIIAAFWLNDYLHGHVRQPFFSELYEAGLSFFNFPAVLGALLRPRAPTFRVTPKDVSLREDSLSPLAKPFYAMVILMLAAYPFALYRWVTDPMQYEAIIFTIAWNSFNLVFILIGLGIVWERRQVRRKHRLRTREEALIWIGVSASADGEPTGQGRTHQEPGHPVKVEDISEDGLGLVVPKHLDIALGTQLLFRARDSYGNDHELALKVVRTQASPGAHRVGCRFQVSDELAFTGITSYVYGDSQRWVDVWGRHRARKRGPVLVSLVALFRVGIRGMHRNLRGVARIWLKTLKENGVATWKRLWETA